MNLDMGVALDEWHHHWEKESPRYAGQAQGKLLLTSNTHHGLYTHFPSSVYLFTNAYNSKVTLSQDLREVLFENTNENKKVTKRESIKKEFYGIFVFV